MAKVRDGLSEDNDKWPVLLETRGKHLPSKENCSLPSLVVEKRGTHQRGRKDARVTGAQ